jgi:LGFP repeat
VADWGNTAPFSYDKFIVRWDRDGANVGQMDVAGGRGGHWSAPVSAVGNYSVVAEGCDTGVGGSTCKQGFTVPANVVVTFPGPDPHRFDCERRPIEPLLSRWDALGARFGPLGCPTGPEAPIAGRAGRAMPFEHGQIVTSPEQGTSMVVAVYQQGEDVVADWDNTVPFNYDFFIVRIDFEGRNIAQVDVKDGPRSSGRWTLHNHREDDDTTTPIADNPGRYSVVIEGCDGHLLATSSCKQGFTAAASVEYRSFGVLSFADLRTPRTLDDVLQHKHERAQIATNYIACSRQLADVFKNEDDFMNTAIAKLYVVNDQIPPPGTTSDALPARCRQSRFPMITEVNDAVRSQEIKSKSPPRDLLAKEPANTTSRSRDTSH